MLNMVCEYNIIVFAFTYHILHMILPSHTQCCLDNLRKDVMLPPPLLCKDIVEDMLIDTVSQ